MNVNLEWIFEPLPVEQDLQPRCCGEAINDPGKCPNNLCVLYGGAGCQEKSCIGYFN